MSKPLNFAVIGCGMLARQQHIPNIVKSSEMILHTCCDLDDAILAECKDIHGALNISKDFVATINNPEIDAICLATTEKMRLPVIKVAAAANKPVFCEKPLANSIEEMYQIQEIVKQANIPFCVGHNRRSSPAMVKAQNIFRNHLEHPKPCKWRYDREGENRIPQEDDGIPGMSIRVNDDWYSWKGWVFNKEHNDKGPMLFEMTHFTDICNWFINEEPEEVTAIESGMFNNGIIIRYKNGAMATIMMTANGTFGYTKELFEVCGNGAIVVVDHMLEVRTAGIENAAAVEKFPFLKDRHPEIGQEGGFTGWMEKKRQACKEAAQSGNDMDIFTAEPNKGHFEHLEQFVEEIRGNRNQVCGIDDTIRATKIAFAAIKSSQERRVIKISEI